MTPLPERDENDLVASDEELQADAMHVSNNNTSPLDAEQQHQSSPLHDSIAVSKDNDILDNANKNPNLTPWRHATSTAALCLCTLTHSYLLISVFPYSGFMAIDLIEGVDEESAGRYAGLIAAFFMVGRTLTAFHWGQLEDRYGRIPILLSSLALSGLFTVLFGLSRTFAWALVWRCLLGMSNGLVGTAKTVVSELAGSPSQETSTMGLVLGMWGWGFLISPAVSGALAEPVKQYPESTLVQRFQPFLSKFPFVLPNLVGGLVCIVTIVAVILFVQETLPEDQRRSAKYVFADLWTWCKRKVSCGRRLPKRRLSSIEFTPLPQTSGDESSEQGRTNQHASAEARPQLKAKQSDLYLEVPMEEESEAHYASGESTATIGSLWARPNTRWHLIVYWTFSFVVIAVDEAFPLFCISREAGLGLSEASIGKILSGSGLLFAVAQYFVYGFLVDRYGLYGSIQLGGFAASALMTLFPFSVLIARGTGEGEMTWAPYLFLCFVSASVRVFSLAFFSSITIATNRTVSSSLRGSMNGLSMLGGSVAKAMGPAFAGFLVTFSLSSGVVPPRAGAFLIFFVIALVSFFASLCSVTLASESNGIGREENRAAAPSQTNP